MNEFRTLLDRFWITREEDPELYFAVKRAIPSYRRLISDLLGWNLIVNSSVIKLEKVPPRAQPWMGISQFQEPLDYCLLCALLLFLADLDNGAPFLLSTLTQALESFLSEIKPVDWTQFIHRKALVRVLQYAQETGLIAVYDGSSAGFSSNQDQEVLYENTGLSRHFPVHFGRDILCCRSIADFEAFSWTGNDTDCRRHRAYQQLTLSPGLYWTDGDSEDYEYVKNQRRLMGSSLDSVLEGKLQVHRNGAFFLLSEGDRCGAVHPGSRAMSDAALLLCGQLREEIRLGTYPRQGDDTVVLSHRDFRQEVQRCRERWGNGWGAQMRAMSLDRVVQEMTAYMAGWMLLEDTGEDILLLPAVGKLVGKYPDTYRNELNKEDDHGPLEDE